ncbi:MAG: PilT/PilU family type 4a pilus ATPase [Myxococcaceae bacterium]|nr:PilT/PilU family type 4a pilus ATPase [Myxococcaceae bacterium]MCI0670259.1 PilT/PilU family type 4a pilus ATPase [Myxococcaceae bacterium]
MKPIEQLLQLLTRPGVSEVVLTSGRMPLAKVGGVHRAIGTQALTTVDIERLLQDAAAPDLAAQEGRPVQWRVTSPSAGAVDVTALRRSDVVQVRITPARGGAEGGPPSPSATGAPAPAGPSSQPPAEAHPVPPARPATGVTSVATHAARAGVDAAAALAALLEAARAAGASDLHLVAGRPPLVRMAGVLTPEGEVLPADRVKDMVRAMLPERVEAVFAREGSCDFALEHPTAGRFRANVVRQRTGLKACLRIIPRDIPTLDALGLPASIAQATQHHQGLIVLSGPSGSGKTSTLAALVDLINRETTHHVITVEDPVEYVHPRKRAMMSQREVGVHTRTFASALKASLREDPDVIVVGELRDTETVRMALSASETGHLVLATMNTPSAAKTIDRLVDLFPPADQAQVRMSLSTGLRLIVSQRLLPDAAGTGMVAAAELLTGSVALGNLIREEKTHQIPSLQQRGKGLGMVRFDDSLVDLVRAGKTTLAIAREYAESPDELTAVVQGRPSVANPAGPSAAAAGDAQRRPNVLGMVGSLVGKK